MKALRRQGKAPALKDGHPGSADFFDWVVPIQFLDGQVGK